MRGGGRDRSGLAPARAARPIRAGERIHVVGAAGAGASAAALLAASGRRRRERLRSRRALAVHAARSRRAGIVVAAATTPATSPAAAARAAGGDQGAHGDRPGQRGAGRGPGRRHPARAVAAGRRRRRRGPAARRRGGDARQEHLGRLAGPRAGRGGLDPSAFVGALLPAPHRQAAGDGAPRARRRRSWWRPTSTPATSTRTGRRRDPHLSRVGPPGRLRRRRGGGRCFAAWLRRAAQSPSRSLVANVADPGVRRRRTAPRLAGRRVAGRAGGRLAGGSAGRARTAAIRDGAGPAPTLVGRISAAGPDGTTLRVARHRARRAVTVRLRPAGRHNAANALGVAGAAMRAGLPDRGHRWPASPVSPASAGASSARARGAASSSTTTTATIPRRSVRRSRRVRQLEPGRRIWAVYEPLTYHRTAALLDAVRRGAGDRRRCRHRGHLGRPRPGHDDRVARRRWPRPSRGNGRNPAVARLGGGNGGLARRGGPGRATPSWYGRWPELSDRRAAARGPGGGR